MSTAKEKAEELVDKYLISVEVSFKEDSIPRIVNAPMRIKSAKQCALIAVDEILEYHESLYNKGFKDVHIAISSPIKTYNDILNPLLKYWREVRTEIEKL